MRRALPMTLCLMLLSERALCQDAAPERRATTLVAEATALEQRGRFAAALERFTEAFRLVQSPALLVPIARLHGQLGQPLEGLRALQSYEDRMVSLTPVVAALRQRLLGEVARLVVFVEALGQQVWIDGHLVSPPSFCLGDGRICVAVDVDPGAHVIRLPGRTVGVTAGPGQHLWVQGRTEAPARPGARFRAELDAQAAYRLIAGRSLGAAALLASLGSEQPGWFGGIRIGAEIGAAPDGCVALITGAGPGFTWRLGTRSRLGIAATISYAHLLPGCPADAVFVDRPSLMGSVQLLGSVALIERSWGGLHLGWQIGPGLLLPLGQDGVSLSFAAGLGPGVRF